MTNYFQVALIGSTWSWLMNLLEVLFGSLKELCRQFVSKLWKHLLTTRCGVRSPRYLAAAWETLHMFVQRFEHNPPHHLIFSCQCILPSHARRKDASEDCHPQHPRCRGLEELLTLPDKCARAIEGRAWHTPRDIQLGQLGLYGPRSSYTKPQKNKASGAHQICVAA